MELAFSVEDLPQKYPMRMVDEFLTVEPGKGAEAIKIIKDDDYFLTPGIAGDSKVFPRPIVLEALAQTGVAAILSLPENQSKNVFFGGIKSAEFYDDFRPGDELLLAVEMRKFRQTVGTGHCTVTRNNKVVCEADLTFIVVDR